MINGERLMTKGRQVTDTERVAGRHRTARRALWLAIAVIIGWFALGSVIGPAAGQLSTAQENDNATFLPADAEATRAIEAQQAFAPEAATPMVVLFTGDQPLSQAQLGAVQGFVEAVPGLTVETGGSSPATVADFMTAAPVVAVPAEDGQAVLVTVYLAEAKTTDALDNGESPIQAVAHTLADESAAVADDAGLDARVTGPGGLLADLIDVFGAIDGTLLLATALVVTVILILVYRSPYLWVIPLVSAGFALSVASAVVYYLANNDVLQLNGQSQGILTVLVFGAGTDYALLMVSRYREELHRHDDPVDAMRAAWRGTVEPITASAGTASLGLLMMLFSELNANKSTGPVAAIGIASALVVMLTLLPALLIVPSAALPLGALLVVMVPGLLLSSFTSVPMAPFVVAGGVAALLTLVAVVVGGVLRLRLPAERRPRLLAQPAVRWAFWPRIPNHDDVDDKLSGVWSRIAGTIGRRSRLVWAAAASGLLALAFFTTALEAEGMATTDLFVERVDSVVGQEQLAEHFPAGEGSPAVVIGPADRLDAMTQALEQMDGIAAVAPFTGEATSDPSAAEPLVVDGRVMLDVTLADAADSEAAMQTVVEMRTTLQDVAGDDVLVGGTSAVSYDTQQASKRDIRVVIPLVLLVILGILVVLLRSLVAPLLLIATVVLSFFATLGVSAIAFDIRGFPGADTSFPLFAFVFLVALGIDYNIFLMTRVREESLRSGTRPGILRGLTVTGGVITSAGIVLAATFLVLGVLPLVILQQIGFAVAAGVLLDTLIVRSLLVPALSYDIGRRIWWPSRLGSAPDHNEPGDSLVSTALPPTSSTR